MTIQEMIQRLDDAPNEGEAIKIAAELLAPIEAYCDLYKTSLRKQVHAQEMGKIASNYVKKGINFTETKLEREGRCSKAYKEEQKKYGKAMEIRTFLKTYLAGVKMSHEMEVAKIYQTSAEIKKGLYKTGQ